MKAAVIALASAKGGSGKTTVTATFGTLLAVMGKRVLMIDTDASTNGLSLFYVNHLAAETRQGEKPGFGLFERSEPGQGLKILELAENLYLLPATYQFQNTGSVELSTYSLSLSMAVTHYRGDFDYILLDAQAGSDSFAEVAISPNISDQVVIVSEYDPVSAAGVERLKALFSDSLSYQRAWILLNKVLPEFVKSFSDFLEIARYLSPLPWTADVVRAYARRTLAIDVVDVNDFTIAAVHALRPLLDQQTQLEFDAWLAERAFELRTPVKRQLDDAKAELASLRMQRGRLVRAMELRRYLIQLTPLVLGVVVFFIGRIWLTESTSAVFAVTVGGAGVLIAAGIRTFPGLETGALDTEIEYSESRVRRLTELVDSDEISPPAFRLGVR